MIFFSLNACNAENERNMYSGVEDEEIESKQPDGYDSMFPWHEPMGHGIGVMPGRVVWAFDQQCINWTEGHWWNFANFEEAIIRNMIDCGIATLAGTKTSDQGWAMLFKAHNKLRGKGETGYKNGEKIAIKINMNGAGWTGPNDEYTTNAFTNPVALRMLLLSMVENGEVDANDITVYDASRNIPDFMRNYCAKGKLAGVKFIYSDKDSSNDRMPDESCPLVWSKEFSGEQSFLPTCVTEAEYLINFADLKGHSMNGITLTAKNHFGSIINSNRMAPPLGANIHQFVTANAMGQYTVLVDLMGNYQLGKKTFLYMLDGIVVFPGESSSTSASSDNCKWMSEPFNGGYTASLFFSQDPVAIDAVGADFLANEPTILKYNSVIRNNPNVENYLHEAGNVAHAPSGTVYKDGNGEIVTNLGVHEHWNNSKDKKYSRNLGKDEGIELIRICK